VLQEVEHVIADCEHSLKAIKFMWYVEQVINTYVRLFGLKQMGRMDINPQ